jgi:hypothetical protein
METLRVKWARLVSDTLGFNALFIASLKDHNAWGNINNIIALSIRESGRPDV